MDIHFFFPVQPSPLPLSSSFEKPSFFFTEPDFSDDWWSSCFSFTPISFLSPPVSSKHKGVLYALVG